MFREAPKGGSGWRSLENPRNRRNPAIALALIPFHHGSRSGLRFASLAQKDSLELLTEENRALTLAERLQALARRAWVIQRRSFDEVPSRVLRTIRPFGQLPPEGETREEAFEHRKNLQDSALRVCKKKSISLLRV